MLSSLDWILIARFRIWKVVGTYHLTALGRVEILPHPTSSTWRLELIS